MLAAESLEPDGDIMTVMREISTTDRNVCRVCGVMVPLATLRQLSGYLVDVHGQHEHQSLLGERNHLNFLDSFGDSAHQEMIAAVEGEVPPLEGTRVPPSARCARKTPSARSGSST